MDKNGDGHISRDEARDATWSNRFSELDKDNDGRLSQSEFNAMQAGAGATGSTGSSGAPLTSGTNAARPQAQHPQAVIAAADGRPRERAPLTEKS